MSDMGLAEIAERWTEGLKKAASRAREMALKQNPLAWTQIASSLDEMRKKGESVIVMKALSRQQVMETLDRKVESMKVH